MQSACREFANDYNVPPRRRPGRSCRSAHLGRQKQKGLARGDERGLL